MENTIIYKTEERPPVRGRLMYIPRYFYKVNDDGTRDRSEKYADGYKIHPAFLKDGRMLKGVWVGFKHYDDTDKRSPTTVT